MIDSEKFHEWKVWVSQNKLTTIGSVWLGLMATNLAYQFTRPVPLQLKLIHSRVYSQFGTFLSHPRLPAAQRPPPPRSLRLVASSPSSDPPNSILTPRVRSDRRRGGLHWPGGGARSEHEAKEGAGLLSGVERSRGRGRSGVRNGLYHQHFFCFAYLFAHCLVHYVISCLLARQACSLVSASLSPRPPPPPPPPAITSCSRRPSWSPATSRTQRVPEL